MTEQVVLLDETGRATGEADKHAVHHGSTPLHLAFSCYVLDESGRLLVTRRALSKATFPGVWTNTCCGHPAPRETIADAVVRRTGQELGITLHDLRLVLPAFRYTALMDNGVLENEMCPVFTARVSGSVDDVRADPAEIEDHHWEPWAEFRESVLDGRDISTWCREQVAQLPVDLAAAQQRPESELPPAAVRR